MKIAVIGAGYVGLVTGACFAEAGHRVTSVDVDQAKIVMLNEGRMPIYEPGLAEIIGKGRRKRTLAFSCRSEPAVSTADIVFIAVGTPPRQADGHADLSNLRGAVTEIAPSLQNGCLVVVKSTVPVGTGDQIASMIHRLRPALDFDVASNPEFLRAGCAIRDFKEPDRVVIGADSNRAAVILKEIYAAMGIEPVRIVVTQRRSAELIKYAANGFLATKIAFINEIADLCESVDARVSEVALGVGLDSRIGLQFLNAGPGFGGSCFPKDARALVKTGEEYGAAMSIMEAVLASNDRCKNSMAARIRAASGGELRGKRIAMLGLTFKAGTDDMREAASIALASALVEQGATVHAYDPVGIERAKPLLPASVRYHASVLDAARGADALVILTEWNEFRSLDFARIKHVMITPLLMDFRNIFREDQVARAGLAYCGIGNRSSPVGERRPALVFEGWSSQTRRTSKVARRKRESESTAVASPGIAAAE
jgi:UDPglucose 6-dehydrogenase